MTATVEIDEWNGPGTGTVTHGVVNLNVGSVDSPNIQVSSATSIHVGTNAYAKYNKLHFTDLGGANTVSNIRIYISEGSFLAGETLQTNLMPNGNTAYVSTPYMAPTRTTYSAFIINKDSPINVTPDTANLGINGSLTGELAAPGYSDFWKWQIQTNSTIGKGALKAKTFTFLWDEE